jgi:hypothetical protein
MTLLADVVAASSEIAETNSRSRKIAILAALLLRLDTDEIPIAVGFLSSVPHQGRGRTRLLHHLRRRDS